MNEREWWQLASDKLQEQGGKCPVCGKRLSLWDFPKPQLAHRVRRGVVIRKLGPRYEWHPKLVMLTCPECNDRALLGAAHPLDEAALLDEVAGSTVGDRE